MKRAPEVAWIVVDEPDDLETELGMAVDVAQHLGTGVPRTHQQDPRPAVCSTERRRNAKRRLWNRIAPNTIIADRAPDHDRRRAGSDARHRDRRAGRARAPSTKLVTPDRTHPPRLLHARVSPHLPVETEQVVAEQMDQHDRRQEDPEVPPAVRRHTTVESKDERDQVRRHDDQRVEQRERHVAPHTGDDAARAGRAGPSDTRLLGSSRSRPPHRRRQQTVGKEAADFTVPRA